MAAKISIDSEVVTPPSERVGTFPLNELEVGESILVRAETKDERRIVRSRLSAAVNYQRKTKGKRFIIRTIDQLSIRCWRTE